MPGYSGTSLPKKLGIKPGLRVSLVNVPTDVRPELRHAFAECKLVRRAPLDFIFLFSKSLPDLAPQLKQAAKSLVPAGMLWVSWPKKISGVAADLTENLIRQIGLNAGRVDVKVCAVTDVWSGLEFVIPVTDRTPAT